MQFRGSLNRRIETRRVRGWRRVGSTAPSATRSATIPPRRRVWIACYTNRKFIASCIKTTIRSCYESMTAEWRSAAAVIRRSRALASTGRNSSSRTRNSTCTDAPTRLNACSWQSDTSFTTTTRRVYYRIILTTMPVTLQPMKITTRDEHSSSVHIWHLWRFCCIGINGSSSSSSSSSSDSVCMLVDVKIKKKPLICSNDVFYLFMQTHMCDMQTTTTKRKSNMQTTSDYLRPYFDMWIASTPQVTFFKATLRIESSSSWRFLHDDSSLYV